jgi:YebC/PmpR family DNA-binding regulatory protein
MVEAMSDNRNRTVSDVRHAFSKFGGNLGTDGSVSYLFNKIGIIHVAKAYPEEEILDIALEAGADDLVDEEEYFEIITSSSNLSTVLESLKQNNIENTNAELTLRAETSVALDQEMSEKVLKIMDFMDELDDVQEVHTNAEFPENFEVKE